MVVFKRIQFVFKWSGDIVVTLALFCIWTQALGVQFSIIIQFLPNICISLELFNPVLNTLNMQLELMLHSDMLTNISFQTLNNFFIYSRACRSTKRAVCFWNLWDRLALVPISVHVKHASWECLALAFDFVTIIFFIYLFSYVLGRIF